MSQRSSMVAVGAALAYLVVTAPAHAATPPSSAALKAAGLSVAWPFAGKAEAVVQPGQRLVVRVRARRSDARIARVALVRLDPAGKPVHVVATQRGTGTFTVAVPPLGAAPYLLRLVVAGRTYGTRLTTPAGTCPSLDNQAALALTVSPTAAPPGTTLDLTLTNQGPGCGSSGVDWDWQQQQPDGNWLHVGPQLAFTANLRFVPAGTSTVDHPVVPALPPGAYRLVRYGIETSAPFTILP